jgi:hypothetical protein
VESIQLLNLLPGLIQNTLINGVWYVNIGSGDIIEVREHLILGLIWQIIRRGLLGKIDIKP